MTAASEKQAVADLRGVRGWLLFLCIGLTILSPMASLLFWAISLITAVPAFQRIDGLMAATVTDLAFSLILLTYGIYAGVALWRVHPNAVGIAKSYFWARLVYVLVAVSLLASVDFPRSSQGVVVFEFLKSLITAALTFAIWYTYLCRSKRVKATYGPQPPPTFHGIRNYAELFDIRAYGFPFIVAIAWVVASYFGGSLHDLIRRIFGHGAPGNPPFQYHLLVIAGAVVRAGLFLLLSLTVKRFWALPLIWGVVNMFVSRALYAGMSDVFGVSNTIWDILAPLDLLKAFFYGFLFMAALILAVRWRGPRIIGFCTTLVAASIVHTLIFDIPSIIADDLLFTLERLIFEWMYGVIFGLVLYGGFYLHFQGRGCTTGRWESA